MLRLPPILMSTKVRTSPSHAESPTPCSRPTRQPQNRTRHRSSSSRISINCHKDWGWRTITITAFSIPTKQRPTHLKIPTSEYAACATIQSSMEKTTTAKRVTILIFSTAREAEGTCGFQGQDQRVRLEIRGSFGLIWWLEPSNRAQFLSPKRVHHRNFWNNQKFGRWKKARTDQLAVKKAEGNQILLDPQKWKHWRNQEFDQQIHAGYWW